MPDNYKSFEVHLDWTESIQTELEVATDRLIFRAEAMDQILTHLSTYGPFEGIPLGIKIGNQLFDFYVDLQDNLQIAVDGTYIEASIKKRGGKDKFLQDIQDTTFTLLRAKGAITDSDIQETPYIIVQDDQLLKLIVLGLTTYTIIKATIEQIRQVADAVSDLVTLAIPDLAPPSVVIKISAYVKYALKLVFELAYLIALLLAVKNLVEQIVELIFPKLRYLKYMKVKRLMEIACQYHGKTLQSSVLNTYSNLAILPIPRETRVKNWWEYLQSSIPDAFNKGYPTDADSTRTADELRQFIEAYLNVETRVVGDVVYMEDRSFWDNLASMTVASNFNLQDIRENLFAVDTSTAWKRYALAYRQDSADINTYDSVRGKSVEYQTDPILVGNSDLVTIKGADIRNIPFSLAYRKGELNWVEKQVKKVAQACDFLTGSNFTARVDNRKGVMQISQQFFSVPKLMWIVGDRQPANYLDIIGAPAVYNARHTSNQVAVNMYRYKNDNDVQFTADNFTDVLNNRNVILETGQQVELQTMSYLPFQVLATSVSYRTKSTDGFNTQTSLVYED